MIFEFFFSGDRPVALGVNLLLLGLTLTSVAIVVREWRRVAVELAPIQKLEEWLHPKVLTQDRDVIRRSIREWSGIDPRSRKEPGPILLRRILDLERIGERPSVDVAGLTALSREQLRDALGFTTAIGPILVLLGLLGTLWGLGTAITELATTLGTTDFEAAQLKTAILGTLGGMQTAFSTTLMGIAGTVIVRIGSSFVRHRQSILLRRLEQVLVTGLVPLYEVSGESALPAAAAALQELNRGLKTDFDKLLNILLARGHQLSTQVEQGLQRIDMSFQQRSEALLAATGQAMSSVLDMLGRRHEQDPSLADYVRTVQATTEDLKRSVEVAQGLIPQLEERLGHLIQGQSEALEQALTSHAEGIRPVMADQANATRALADAAELSKQSVSALQAQLASLTSSFEAARASWESVDQLVQDVGEACARAIAEGLHGFTGELRSQADSHSVERERLAGAMAGLHRSLTETLDRLHDERGAAQQRSLEVLETTREVTMDGLRRILDSLQGQLRLQGGEYERATRELAAEIRDLSLGLRAPSGNHDISDYVSDFFAETSTGSTSDSVLTDDDPWVTDDAH